MDSNKFTFTTTLLIDDGEIDVLVNRRLLELSHFSENIIVANTAEEALQFLKIECTSAAYAPDLILLDVYLPGISGYDFIEEFKKLPSFIRTKTKIILLSVSQNPQILATILKNDFVLTQIEKPLTLESLSELSTILKEPVPQAVKI